MRPRTGLVVVLVALAAASAGLLPVQLSYVTSDSMEPTLSEGDGYVLVEGDISRGDVITFSTADGYVTHRVVGVGVDGYTTRGDANPTTDQAAGMPPVEDGQVLGKVLTLGGNLVVLPGLGTVATFVAAYRPFLIVGLVALLLASVVAERSSHAGAVPNRGIARVGDAAFPLLIGVTLACVAVLAVSVTTRHLTFVATAAENGATLTVGEPAVRQVAVDIVRAPFTQVVVDTQGATAVASDVSGTSATLDLRVPAQSEPGPITTAVAVHPYPAVVPRRLVVWLHGIHPWVACVGSTLFVVGPLWLAYGLLFDGREPFHDGPSVRGGVE
jgi:signal peptidase